MSLLPVGIGNAGGEYTLDNSLRFRQSAGAYLTRPQSSGNQTTWTWSAWVKLGYLNNDQWLFGGYYATNNFTGITVNLNTGIQIYQKNSNNTLYLVREAPIRRDFSSWYHFVIAYDSTQATSTNRIRFYVNGEQITSFASATWPDLNRNSWLNYNVASTNIGRGLTTGNGQFDGYQTEINYVDGQALTADDFGEFDGTTGVWKPKRYTGSYGTNGFYLPTTATTQAEGFNTVLFTGTSQDNQTISDVGFQPDLVWLKSRSNAQNHYLIDSVRGGSAFLYSNATNADNTTRSWITEFTNDGFTATDQVISNGYTYAAWTWDAGANQTSTGISSVAYTGNGVPMKVSGFGFSPDLVIAKARSAGSPLLYDSVRGAGYALQPNSTGAEFYDITRLASYDSDGFSYGSFATGTNAAGTEYIAWGWDAGDGDPVSNTQGTIPSTVKASDTTGFSIVSWTATGIGSDTIGHGLSTAPSVVIKKERNANDSWFVQHTSYTSGAYSQFLEGTQAESPSAAYWNNTFPTSTVFSQGTVMNSGNSCIAYCFSEVSGVSSFGSYTGTGSAGKAITGLGFRPGFLMIKRTDATAEWIIVDSTRSPFNPANNILGIDGLGESSYGTTNRNIDFDDDGFTIQSTAAGGTTALNASGGTYMYMAFKGSYSDYVSPLNDTGTIDSRVKANTEKGFSIVSYEGTGSAGTVGHGLSSAPEMVIVKNRDAAYHWATYHKDLTSAAYSVYLSLNYAESTNSTVAKYWDSTDPTSTVFSIGASNTYTNTASNNFIAYCFHSVAGYSDFGTYTGTGSSGKAVTGLGFQPAWLMVKRTDAAEGWQMLDNTRNPVAPHNSLLEANQTSAEITNSSRDTVFDSDGFTINNTSNAMNASGGTYIYMAFADTRDAQFNFDASGNKNNFTANNINSNASSESSYDIMTDVPTLTDENTANYCTLVPYTFRTSHGGPMTLSEGNLKAVPIASTAASVVASMSPISGKFYWEITFPVVASASTGYGLCTTENVQSASTGASGIYYTRGSGGTIVSGGSTVASSVGTPAAGDVMSIAYDADANQATFRLKNVVLGTGAYSVPTTSNLLPFIYMASTSNAAYANFGQRPFAYTPPTGFLPLNTYNLPDSTIVDGSQHMNVSLYNGTGASGHAITGVGFQPDIVWIKSRSQVSSHGLHDSLRVIGSAEEILYPNLTNNGNTGGAFLSSFDSDGFTVNNNNSGNGSGHTYVGWTWKAGGSGVSNSAGTNGATVASVYSANQDAGISIVTYTGTRTTDQGETGTPDTIYHGLGKKPDMVITKNRTTQTYPNWNVWHTGYQPDTTHLNYQLWLHLTNGANNAGWQRTDQGFTSNLFCPARYAYDNVNGVDYVAYCFTSIEGFSSFGGYVGNGSSDGPFIYTGFRPAFILLKAASRTGHWTIFDSSRDTHNLVDHQLEPNYSSAESTPSVKGGDFLSNGWKCRSTETEVNGSGSSYVYAAFAENPFKNALAR